MFAIIGGWPVDEALDADQLDHIAATVREEPGFVRGYWGQEAGTSSSAHAVVVLEDEGSATAMADRVRAAIPSATIHVVAVLAQAEARGRAR